MKLYQPPSLRYNRGMFDFLKKKGEENDEIQQVAEKQLREKIPIIESLRDYDSGKKNISTRTAEERLPHIRVAHD